MDKDKIAIYKCENCAYPNSVEPHQHNEVYDAVCSSWYMLGMDKDNYGTEAWNPLGEMIHSKMNVLIKPNLVKHENGNKEGGLECLYTQPSVVAPIIDYVWKALNGDGKITIADAPVQECDFEKLTTESGYKKLIEQYRQRGVNIELKDLRGMRSVVEHGVHRQIEQPSEYVTVDLGGDSEFADLDEREVRNLRITNYDPAIMNSHHSHEKHEYMIAKAVLEADVIINVPKPKTHRIAGVTISLKNFVGANVRKECLPHHRIGKTGDESDKKGIVRDFYNYLLDCKNKFERNGNTTSAQVALFGCRVIGRLYSFVTKKSVGFWYGNDTISRTILDINKAVFYADKNGVMQDTPQRRQLIVADMIISGEKEGPLCPSLKQVGMIVSGLDSVGFDKTVATLMGFDIDKIPTLVRAQKIQKYSLSCGQDMEIVSNVDGLNGKTYKSIDVKDTLGFCPTVGWQGHIEL